MQHAISNPNRSNHIWIERKGAIINELLSQSAELEFALDKLLSLKPNSYSSRYTSSRILCSVALEHAESAKLLIVSGNLTSAISLLRLQYEALVRAMWLYFAATDTAADKLAAELTHESATRAQRMPLLSEMLRKLEGKAPTEAMDMLLEFKEYSWKPLSSFVHGGIHAIDRHCRGYPPLLLEQAVKASNGVSMMVGMLLVILSGDSTQRGRISRLQVRFADCLPAHRPEDSES